MKGMRFIFAFILLELCGYGYAGPCKPKSTTTALGGTSSFEATLSASTEIATATETTSAELSTADLSSSVFEPVSSTDARLSSSTELLTSSFTADKTTTTTTIAELSSSTNVLTTSNIVETTTTTTEESAPSGLLLNPSFDEPNGNGDYDGFPWVLTDSVSPMSVRIDNSLARTGSHSAYWSVTSTAQKGRLYQPVSMEGYQLHTLSFWYYVDESQQPQGLDLCTMTIEQIALDGKTTFFLDLLQFESPLPLKTWTKHNVEFNPLMVTPAKIAFSITCYYSAGSGLKVAIDDIQLFKKS